MFNEFGNFVTTLAWILSLYGFVGGFYGAWKNNSKLVESARLATILCFFCLALGIVVLAISFLRDDYLNQYVWQYSNRDMDSIYKVTAIWGGMDGSMLLWVFFLSMMSAVVAWKADSYPRVLIPWTISTLNSSVLFFLTIVTFFTNPFRFIKASFIPADGNGLNPLLQNEYMAAHPPLLYLGFTTFAVPFAFCIGALLSGDLSNEWIRATRRWTLVAWSFLTVGIILGGHWAYIELGWGGFWAWDPVENASFLPWLTGTAFLHSVIVQERKDMLKMWNVWLISLTYFLTVFGTFLTRSGIVQSVHAFASTEVGHVFLYYLAFILSVTLILSVYRRKELAPGRRIESLLSRESAFLINNLILLSIGFATLWGVMFPVLSEAVTGQKQTVGIPFFNAVNVPLFLLLIFMMGVGTLISWRRASFSSLRKTFLSPFLFSLALACLLVWAGITSFYPILSYALCFFVALTIMGEFHRGMKVQRAIAGENAGSLAAAGHLIRRHKTRYGGFIVHLGVIVVTVSITASMAHKIEKEFTLAKNESIQIGRFTLTLNDVTSKETNNYQALVADATVRRTVDGVIAASLKPELRVYTRKKETTTEVALRMGPREDLYLVLAGLSDDETRASFKMFINPLQIWLWFGGLIMVFGSVLILLPSLKTSHASAPAGTASEGVLR